MKKKRHEWLFQWFFLYIYRENIRIYLFYSSITFARWSEYSTYIKNNSQNNKILYYYFNTYLINKTSHVSLLILPIYRNKIKKIFYF